MSDFKMDENHEPYGVTLNLPLSPLHVSSPLCVVRIHSVLCAHLDDDRLYLLFLCDTPTAVECVSLAPV